MKHRVIVAGGRNFNDYALVKETLDRAFAGKQAEIEIVSGQATGADAMGERYARSYRMPVAAFPAAWKDLTAPGAVIRTRRKGGAYNARAGFDRNAKMAKYATHLIAFWDGSSKGTKSMIDLAERRGLKVRVVRYG